MWLPLLLLVAAALAAEPSAGGVLRIVNGESACIKLNSCDICESDGVIQTTCPMSLDSARIATLEAEVARLSAAFDSVSQSVKLPPSPPAPPTAPLPPAAPEPLILSTDDGEPVCGGWFPGHSPCRPYGFDGITERCGSCYATGPASAAGVMVAADMGTGAGPYGGYDWGAPKLVTRAKYYCQYTGTAVGASAFGGSGWGVRETIFQFYGSDTAPSGNAQGGTLLATTRATYRYGSGRLPPLSSIPSPPSPLLQPCGDGVHRIGNFPIPLDYDGGKRAHGRQYPWHRV